MTLAVQASFPLHSSEAVKCSADGIIEMSDDDKVRQVKNFEVYAQSRLGNLFIHSNEADHITTDRTYDIMDTVQK